MQYIFRMILFDSSRCRYNREIEGIYRLRDSTVVCAKCHLRIVIDTVQPDVKYCKCNGVQPSAASNEDCRFFFYQLFNIEIFYYMYIYLLLYYMLFMSNQ